MDCILLFLIICFVSCFVLYADYCAFGAPIWTSRRNINANKKKQSYVRADELPKKYCSISFDDYIKEKCEKCRLYDGYDVCRCRKHFGSVIENIIIYCSEQGNFEEI